MKTQPKRKEQVQLKRRRLLRGAASAAAAVVLPAHAQAWPAKSIRWIVPYTAGGPSDIVARLVAEQLSTVLGQHVLVDNKPGGSSIVAMQALLGSTPDGYTMATADNAVLFNNWHLFDKLLYKQDSFEYVGMTGRFPLVLAVNRAVPANTLMEWVQWAKQNAGKTTYATPGVGTPHHIALATLDDMVGLSMQHVPYRGESAAVVDLAGGQVHSMLMGAATAKQYVKDDRLRFLAVTWQERLSSLPKVPTMAEAGIKNFEVYAEQGILMPAGTPKPVVQRMYLELARVLNLSAVREKLEGVGMYPVPRPPEEFKAYVAKQMIAAGDIIKRKGIIVN